MIDICNRWGRSCQPRGEPGEVCDYTGGGIISRLPPGQLADRPLWLWPACDPRPITGDKSCFCWDTSRFVFNYSDLSNPLSDVTTEGVPDLLRWLKQCQWVFVGVKVALFPLQWSMKDANMWLACWYLLLQPIKFTVVHRPGAQMVMADFLSSLQNSYNRW